MPTSARDPPALRRGSSAPRAAVDPAGRACPASVGAVSHPRPATGADLPAMRTVCALAYRENPLMRWVLPDAATRDDACAAWLGPALERYVAAGRVDVVEEGGEVVALAAWRPVGADLRAGTGAAALPRPAGVLAALVGPGRAAEVLQALAGAAPHAPRPAGPYLNYLAVHPAAQGRGLGSTLVRHGLGALVADAGATDGAPWLGTTDPANHAFYGRLGFRTVAEVALDPLGEDGPVLAVMHGARRAPG